jgi:hypothetical protein
MGTFIIVTTTACNSSHQSMRTSFASVTNSSGNGGNPEVLNHCFGLKKMAKNLCFDSFFPDKSNLLIHPNHGEPVMLAGRGSRVEKRVLKLNNDDRVLLYLDISTVKVPLSSNVKDSLFTYDNNTVVVNINAKEIKENIVLKDKEGNVVLEYCIER